MCYSEGQNIALQRLKFFVRSLNVDPDDGNQDSAAPFLPEEAQSAVQPLKLDSVVMVGHTLGAYVGCLILI